MSKIWVVKIDDLEFNKEILAFKSQKAFTDMVDAFIEDYEDKGFTKDIFFRGNYNGYMAYSKDKTLVSLEYHQTEVIA